MKDTEFDTFSRELVSSDVLPLIKTSLLRDGAVVTKPTELGYNVLKICDGKRADVSEVDIGIVRCTNLFLTLCSLCDEFT